MIWHTDLSKYALTIPWEGLVEDSLQGLVDVNQINVTMQGLAQRGAEEATEEPLYRVVRGWDECITM